METFTAENRRWMENNRCKLHTAICCGEMQNKRMLDKETVMQRAEKEGCTR